LVDGANPGGSTKCYDALVYAVEKLIEVKKKYPNIIGRIIALTDGEDNQSKTSPNDVAKLLRKNNIIVDSFVVGSNCKGLKNITHASGGRCYCPPDINVALQLFESETILSVSLRPKVE
jgi:ubiquitin-conjugating enzyme E2 D/E